MQIIVSHQLTDLDGLGAMVAARKLYPNARAVLTGRLHRLTRDFLVLYKDEINLYYLEEMNLESVDRVIIVDTHQREMLGRLNQSIDWINSEVILYDHHPHSELDWVNLDLSEEVGSATTILISKIKAEGLTLNPFEATLCALAIYADTGNLTYLSTTPADARALAYLLENGANLKIINEFIKEPLKEEQQELLEKLIKNRKDIQIDGINVALFSINYDNYVVGINRVVEQLKRLYHLPSIFVLVYMKNKVEIIGRSSDEAVDVGKICSLLGGGGHAGAGATNLKTDLETASNTLINEIRKNVHPRIRVRTIMSSPVRTVTPGTTIEEVEEILKKYGHNGVVVYEDEIKGIFSRRDLNKVKGHGLLHAPVKAYMSKDIITIDVESPIHRAQELMVKHGVGRLPVTEGKKLVGIVTRSDLLASYYGSETPYQHKNRYGSSLVQIKKVQRDISRQLDNLPDRCLTILKVTGKVAADNQARVYLIGGAVRDLFLNKEIKDLDIVIEGGELVSIFNDLNNRLQGDCVFNEHFRTGTLKLSDGYNIDMAEARREQYLYPGALPEVEVTDILEDLFRRDYTVNALALNITPDNWGELNDFFQGYEDIKKGLLKALHRFSFLDDPTRIIRGIRLANKLGFTFEHETTELIGEAITMGDFSRLAPIRVLKELKLLFREKVTSNLLKILSEIPIFRLLDLNIPIKQELGRQFLELEEYLEDIFKDNLEEEYNGQLEKWVLRFALFLDNVSRKEMENWGIKEVYKDVLSSYQGNLNLYQELKQEMNPVQLVNTLNKLSIDEIIIMLVKAKNEQVRNNLKKYLKLSQLRTAINGNDLLKMGLKPGPVIKKVLKSVYQAKLRGDINTREDELVFARRLIKEIKR